jgi:hypothetical protein
VTVANPVCITSLACRLAQACYYTGYGETPAAGESTQGKPAAEALEDFSMPASWKSDMLPLVRVPCLVPCGSDKAPLEKAWQQKGYSADEIASMGDRVRAVGINTAKANLVCIDLDGPDAFDYISARNLPLPDTWVIGRSNDANRMKRVYRVSPEQRERLPQDAGKWKSGTLEVFWRSQQFIVMGEHPSGGNYTWDGSPETIADLPEEWVAFLPRRKSLDTPLLETREIDLQSLLTKKHSELVDRGFDTGDRNNQLFALAADAFAAEDEARRRVTHEIRLIGTADDLITEVLGRTDLTGFSQVEIDRTLRSAREGRQLAHGFEDRWAYSVGRTRQVSLGPGKTSVAVAECKYAAIAELLPSGFNDRGAKTTIDAGALSIFLNTYLGDRLRYNELGYLIELDGEMLGDIKRLRLMGGIQNRGYKLTDGTLIEALSIAADQNAYHPVRQYLAEIDADQSIPLVDTDRLASELLGVDGELFNVMLQRCLLGAVWRAMQPGCKMDYICVLQGSQGLGKTTFWQILFGDWFKVFNAELGDKDSYMALHDSWGIELGEIDGITSVKQSAKLKNFASTQTDCFRPPYGRVTMRFDRPSILVGSCNRDDFLRDTTGERRYWVIPMKKQLDRDKLNRLRDGIWKSVFNLYRSGLQPHLPADLEQANSDNNLEFTEQSVLFQPLADYLGDRLCASKVKVRLAMAEHDLVQPGRLDKEISATMVQLGWCTHRFRGTCRFWAKESELGNDKLRDEAARLDHAVPRTYQGW